MKKPWDAILDASIYFSFDDSGYRRHARRFRAADVDVAMAGNTCLVTGANSGIGFATAEALARRGAEVRLLCRNRGRGNAALTELHKRTGSDQLRLEVLDVSNLAAIRAWVETCDAQRIDVLVHNAGVLPAERTLTVEGLEATFATHVAGPFALTQLLRGALERAPAARVLWVSSGGMYTQRLSTTDLEWHHRRYDGVTAYAQTKRMQVVLCRLFAERWADTPVRFHAMHPGWVDTPSVRTALPGFHAFTRGRLRTPDEGADTVIWLALAAEPASSTGRFWFDRQSRSEYLLPGKRESPGEREALWTLCADLAAEHCGARPPSERDNESRTG